MKKIISIFLMLCLFLPLSGCEEYIPAAGSPSTPEEGGDNTEDSPSGEITDDPDAFTVTLYYDGSVYKPRSGENIKAQWTDGVSFYTADVGRDGTARISGLDGDYNVTLEGLPDRYVYNPNFYTATNNERRINIDIYRPISTSGRGTGAYDCINIKKAGVYRVELNSPDHKVYFQYAPPTSGTYWVESWASTAEGNYNPKVDVYNGSLAYKLFAYTLDNGGVCDGYTQNFKHIVEIADEQIGDNGQAVFTFAVHADSRNGVYPVYIDFAISLNGSFSLDHADKEVIIPEEEFLQTPEYTGYTFKWAETDTIGAEGRKQFDGNMFKLWKKEDGGDGYYHVYDEETGEYGAILYAKVSSAHRFTEAAFTSIEDAGNSALTVNGSENHKIFIEGLHNHLYNALEFNPQAKGPYFCINGCPCRDNEQWGVGVCGESCEECSDECRNLPDSIMELISGPYYCDSSCPCLALNDGVCDDTCTDCTDKCIKLPSVIEEGYSAVVDANGRKIIISNRLMGYAAFANSDGVYAVTEELKHFLQSFSITQRYFADGEGWVETHPTYRVDAKEEDQWLFACGYYVK